MPPQMDVLHTQQTQMGSSTGHFVQKYAVISCIAQVHLFISFAPHCSSWIERLSSKYLWHWWLRGVVGFQRKIIPKYDAVIRYWRMLCHSELWLFSCVDCSISQSWWGGMHRLFLNSWTLICNSSFIGKTGVSGCWVVVDQHLQSSSKRRDTPRSCPRTFLF